MVPEEAWKDVLALIRAVPEEAFRAERQMDGSYLQQLTAYLVLDRLAGTIGSDFPIRQLGVYYARHGALQIFSVKEMFRPGFLPRLVTWFDESLPEG